MQERRLSPRSGESIDEKEVEKIARLRFGGTRPANLDTEQFSEGDSIRDELLEYFDRLEFQKAFERGVQVWEDAGLFTSAREAGGFQKPDFDRDYRSRFTPDMLAMLADGPPIWTPYDLPLDDADPAKMSYRKILFDAIVKAFYGTAEGKASNTLLIGPSKLVIANREVDLSDILMMRTRYQKPGVVHNIQQYDIQNHGGVSEQELLQRLAGAEQTTGGVLRIEREKLVMPADLGRTSMSVKDWTSSLASSGGRLSTQNIKEAMAFTIYCLATQGWLPDFFDIKKPQDSREALVPGTYIPDEGYTGAVPAFRWDLNFRRFYVGGITGPNDQNTNHGIRLGMRV